MSQDIFALVEHIEGQVSESSFELIAMARRLAGQTGGKTVAVVLGQDVDGITAQMGAADRVLQITGPSVAHFVPTTYVKALAQVVADRTPAVMLFPNSAIGMDVAGGLSVKAGVPLAAYATDVRMENGKAVVTSQIFGGKLNAEAEVNGDTALVTVIAGSASAAEGQAEGAPEVETMAAPEADDRISFVKLVEPEAADVDITKEEILVAVGRGIGDGDDIEIVEELAEALGGAVACSRPVVDAGWLPKSRQVGKSGLKVKPKLYIAVGISGAPEHLEGMRDADLIVAINSDPKAPIFSVADYGITEDLFDVVPAMTEMLES